ncbi:MAG TPA: autotransporter domain-containing protein [Xanthobacteraceae bacterium]|nr:autotransporter domain-containing protein [Xanthobacteraceae bacterium]
MLASSSCVALLVASGGASATSPCYTGPFPFTNNGALSCITVSGTSFAGNIVNSGSGAISPGGPPNDTGILVTNTSTVTGQISNAGTISVSGTGIKIDTNSVVTNGVVNRGTITAGTSGAGINVTGVATFAGGVTNAGSITAGTRGAGLAVVGVSAFSGGMTNTGSITAGSVGMVVTTTSTFIGGITNAGTISAGNVGIGIQAGTFVGGVSNSGTINAFLAGIQVGPSCGCTNATSFSGGINNSGTISAIGVGIGVSNLTAFSGGISNSGTVSLVGATAIRVEAISTFIGGISNSGTIVGGSSGAGIGVGHVNTFTGGITNSGTIVAGSGRAVIGVNAFGTFTGGIVNTGTLVGGISAVGIGVLGGSSFGGGISNAGLIHSSAVDGIAVNDLSLFTGGISNSGTITRAQNGINIGAVSTFSGGITNSGRIAALSLGIIVEAQSFDGHIVNTGTISAANAIWLAGGNAITIDQNAGLIAGNIRFSTNGDTLNVRGGTINGDIIGHNAGDTINFALGSASTFTYGAAYGFTNVSTVNVNSGVVVLDGANHAGSIAVNGGVLQVGDASDTGATLTGSVDVIGGTLAGHGTVAGNVTVENGGVLFPGGSIGTLTIANGPLTFNPGSTFLVQILSGAGNNSAVAVTGTPGTITINGGTVLALPQLGHYGATTYTIATATGGVSNTFTGAGFAAPFTYTGSDSLSYDSNDVFLNLGAGFALLAPAGTNQNQQSVVNGINGSILSGVTPPSQFQNLTSLPGSTLLNALSQLSGENAAGFRDGALQAGNAFLGLLLNPYVDGRGDGFAPAFPFAAEERPALPDAALAFAKFVKANPLANPLANPRDATLGSVPQFRVWGAAYGGSGTIDGNAAVGSQRTTATDAAFAAGVDHLLSPNTTVGFALAGGGTSWGLSGGLGDGRSDMFQAGAYARQRFGDAYLSGALAYSFHDVTTTRTVTIAGTDTLQGRFQANGLGARIEGGYHVAMPFVRLTPYGAVQVQSIFLPAYGESAIAGSNQFALNFASQTATTTRTEIGSWFDHTFVERGHLWTLYGRLAWAHDFGDTPRASAIFQTLPGSSFVVNGAVPNADSALVTAGAKYDLLDGWSFLAKFDGEFSSNSSIYSGTGMIKRTW